MTEPKSPDSTSAPPTPDKRAAHVDWVLEELVDLVNRSPLEVPITLILQGAVVTGKLIGHHKFYGQAASRRVDHVIAGRAGAWSIEAFALRKARGSKPRSRARRTNGVEQTHAGAVQRAEQLAVEFALGTARPLAGNPVSSEGLDDPAQLREIGGQ